MPATHQRPGPVSYHPEALGAVVAIAFAFVAAIVILLIIAVVAGVNVPAMEDVLNSASTSTPLGQASS